MNKPLCIYHGNCADGFAAAWIVREALGKSKVDLYPAEYSNTTPDVKDRDVIMVDFSYKRDVLCKMAEEANSILILDHHKSAIGELTNLPSNVTTVFDMSRSGAMITWDHYFPKKKAPKLIQYIQDRDLWRYSLSGTREIMAFVFTHPYDFKTWTFLMEMDVTKMALYGRYLVKKHDKDIAEYLETAAYRMMLAEYDVPVANVPYMWASDAGHEMAKNEAFSVSYYDTAKYRKFSLRSDKNGEDVSKIAELFGGGGHEHSAGFTIPHSELADHKIYYPEQ